MYALLNAKTYDFNTYKENQYILFDKQITAVGNMSSYKNNNYQEIDVKNSIVMPGLINGHSHIYSTFSRGMNVPFAHRTLLFFATPVLVSIELIYQCMRHDRI